MKHERTYKRCLSTHAGKLGATDRVKELRRRNPAGKYDVADVLHGHENPPIRTVNPWAVVER